MSSGRELYLTLCLLPKMLFLSRVEPLAGHWPNLGHHFCVVLQHPIDPSKVDRQLNSPNRFLSLGI